MSNENKVVLPEPDDIYRGTCADGTRCLHGCHKSDPCHTGSALLATATGLPAQAVAYIDSEVLTSFLSSSNYRPADGWDCHIRHQENKRDTDVPLYSRPQAQADARDAELLGFLQDQCIDLRCFTTSDGEDVGWRTVQHHMDKPHERVVSEVCSDDPRRAIREAMARIERDPYCTGPLHLEDDAAIAAAKGEQQ